MADSSGSKPFVVIGMDGSAASRAAFGDALSAAATMDAELRAIHVYLTEVATIRQALRVDPDAERQLAFDWLNTELRHLEETLGRFPCTVTPAVTQGHVGAALVHRAERASLLVLGSRGLGGVRGLIAGSVTSYCLHHMP